MNIKEQFENETDWRRKALLVELFHSIMLLRHGNEWNVRRTAKSIGKSVGLISENINLAKKIKDGTLDKCESRNKALKLIRGN